MPATDDLCDDLEAERASLDAVVAPLAAEEWMTPTPAVGFDVRDTVSHLCFFDEQATLAILDPAAFEAHKTSLIATMLEGKGDAPDVAIGRSLSAQAGSERMLLQRWLASRRAFDAAARRAAATPEGPPRIAWYGPPMSLASFVSARIMETWAHGVDIRDAVRASLDTANTDRLRHVCHLGYAARGFTFAVHGVSDPGDPVAMVVEAPDGTTWSWGPPVTETDDQITGTALEVALVFTQRRHPSRTKVRATGATAQLWLSIAQAFAGPPTIAVEGR